MVTKICMGDYVTDTYRDAKFHYDLTAEFCPPHLCELGRLYISGVLTTPYTPQGRCADCEDQHVKRRRFVQGCAFSGPENEILYCDPFFSKITEIFDFRRNNFGSKEVLTWDSSSVNTPKKTSSARLWKLDVG